MMESMATTASSDNGDIQKNKCVIQPRILAIYFFIGVWCKPVGILKERQVKTVGRPSHPVLQSLIFQTYFFEPDGPHCSDKHDK